jgi:hypothetical protein
MRKTLLTAVVALAPALFASAAKADVLDQLHLDAMYWEVMNRVRSKPWVRHFVVSASFKKLY